MRAFRLKPKQQFASVLLCLPRHALQTVRMEQALWLLQNSDTPITQIPRIVGYANYTSFYRTFLDFYGISPSDAARSHPQDGGQG